MTDIVARAEEYLQGITPWPWATERSKYVSGWYVFRSVNGCQVLHATESDGLAPADFRFIAASPELVAELVAELKTTRAQLEAAEQ